MAAPDTPAGQATVPKRSLIMRHAARSDVGRVRAKNDDSAYVGRHLAVVADGMGGHAGGDVASAATVLDMIHLDHDNYDGDAGTVLADEIQTANSLLSELVHINPKLAGMGTTVTALLLAEGKLHFAHIGDSRAYRLRNGEFEQISVDHTFVQRLIDEGRLRPEEAETHPHKNVLMRVLGDVDASPELDLDTLDVQPGERWLLCSDGLNYVAGHVVERTVRETKNLRECVDRLVDLTLEAGAPDNVTVVMVEIVERSPDCRSRGGDGGGSRGNHGNRRAPDRKHLRRRAGLGGPRRESRRRPDRSPVPGGRRRPRHGSRSGPRVGQKGVNDRPAPR
jgi:serine/threonine protein phosphatase PrpC